MHFRIRLNLGKSLLALLVALAVMAILVSIAYPMYKQHIIRTRRADGQVALIDLASHMDRYYSDNDTYAGATIESVGLDSASTAHHYYTLVIQSADANSFIIKAVPTGIQATEDTQCGTLLLNSFDQKGYSGTGPMSECWGK